MCCNGLNGLTDQVHLRMMSKGKEITMALDSHNLTALMEESLNMWSFGLGVPKEALLKILLKGQEGDLSGYEEV